MQRQVAVPWVLVSHGLCVQYLVLRPEDAASSGGNYKVGQTPPDSLLLFVPLHLCGIFFLIYLFYLFIFGCIGSSLLRGLSLVAASGGYSSLGAWASHSSGFFCCGAWALGARASVVVARVLNSCGSRALECRLSSCGAQD